MKHGYLQARYKTGNTVCRGYDNICLIIENPGHRFKQVFIIREVTPGHTISLEKPVNLVSPALEDFLQWTQNRKTIVLGDVKQIFFHHVVDPNDSLASLLPLSWQLNFGVRPTYPGIVFELTGFDPFLPLVGYCRMRREIVVKNSLLI